MSSESENSSLGSDSDEVGGGQRGYQSERKSFALSVLKEHQSRGVGRRAPRPLSELQSAAPEGILCVESTFVSREEFMLAIAEFNERDGKGSVYKRLDTLGITCVCSRSESCKYTIAGHFKGTERDEGWVCSRCDVHTCGRNRGPQCHMWRIAGCKTFAHTTTYELDLGGSPIDRDPWVRGCQGAGEATAGPLRQLAGRGVQRW